MEEPMGTPAITRFVPNEDQYSWTFGGYQPVMRVRPGDVLDLYTEDAFGGRIRTTEDLPSRSIVYPFINPQTGPFFVEGAEPGDSLAIHLIDVQPARDWAVSTTVPLFGSLTGTKYTATLQPALPERTWLYDVDRTAGRVLFRALDSDVSVGLPLEPFLGTIGVAPAANEARNVLALKFVMYEALGGGAPRSLRSDNLGKTHAASLLRMYIDVPDEVAIGARRRAPITR
jgi:acetamidase/formamidase